MYNFNIITQNFIELSNIRNPWVYPWVMNLVYMSFANLPLFKKNPGIN
jgi:hypothetical protein